MFVVDRSALAVIVPLMLLVAVVLWSNRPTTAPQQADIRAQESLPKQERAQTVAANLPSR